MTALEIINEAYRRLGAEPRTEQALAALGNLNRILSNFSYWIEADLPNINLTMNETSPFPDYYNEAFITKLAIKEANPNIADMTTRQALAIEDADNMFKLSFREALGKKPKAGMTVT